MDLYIFGAGASAAECAPATRDFLARAYQYLAPAFDEQVEQVWRFLEEVFEVPVDGPGAFDALPAVDEVISLVDWSLHVDQGLGPHYDPARLYQVRRALEHLLCATLDAALDRRTPAAHSPHARFAHALRERPAGSYALLSLNYDTLLDDALLASGLPPDYGLDAPTGGPLLLKLHGSLNWAHCPACDQIEVAREQVAHLLPRVAGLACSRCGNRRLVGVIISPTWLKRYTLPPLGRVFHLALQAVREARRIIFAGYSLPPADVAIHHLLRRGLLTRQVKGRPLVEVINHRPSPEVTDRFTRLFGPDVRFDFTGFQGQT
ncbi:MAG: hypothetical protein ACOY93_00650 [Bacillota bacterium]